MCIALLLALTLIGHMRKPGVVQSFRTTPELAQMVRACAEQHGRSVSEEWRLAAEFYGLSMLLADLDHEATKQALGEEWRLTRDQVVEHLTAIVAEAKREPKLVAEVQEKLAQARTAHLN